MMLLTKSSEIHFQYISFSILVQQIGWLFYEPATSDGALGMHTVCIFMLRNKPKMFTYSFYTSSFFISHILFLAYMARYAINNVIGFTIELDYRIVSSIAYRASNES